MPLLYITSNCLKTFGTFSILFLIIMKDKGPKLVQYIHHRSLTITKTNFALDFLKNNTSSTSTS